MFVLSEDFDCSLGCLSLKVDSGQWTVNSESEFPSPSARKFSILIKTKVNSSGKVLIELFQKFAEHEAEPRTNAKASAFASVLQTGEALLLLFGQSQYFPNVGKYCALSPRATIGRAMLHRGLVWVTVYPPNPPASGRALIYSANVIVQRSERRFLVPSARYVRLRRTRIN